MATLHPKSRAQFTTNWTFYLEQMAKGPGGLDSASAMKTSGDLYVGLGVEDFTIRSLAFVQSTSASLAVAGAAPIDRSAVSALFSTYEAQDVADANSIFSGAPLFVPVGSPSIADIQARVRAAYSKAKLGLP
jgi:hypothetical protein